MDQAPIRSLPTWPARHYGAARVADTSMQRHEVGHIMGQTTQGSDDAKHLRTGLLPEKGSSQSLQGFAARTAQPPFAVARGIAESLYSSWLKEFLEAGRKRLARAGHGAQATSVEVQALRAEARVLKEALAEQMLANRLFPSSRIGSRPAGSRRTGLISTSQRAHCSLATPRAASSSWGANVAPPALIDIDNHSHCDIFAVSGLGAGSSVACAAWGFTLPGSSYRQRQDARP